MVRPKHNEGRYHGSRGACYLHGDQDDERKKHGKDDGLLPVVQAETQHALPYWKWEVVLQNGTYDAELSTRKLSTHEVA